MLQRYSLGRVRDGLQKRMVCVDSTTHGQVHRDTCELLESRVCNGPLALAAGEDLDGLTAMGTVEVAHVLGHAQNRHTGLPEQARRAARASARLTATVVLPTPPLPLATARTYEMPGMRRVGTRSLLIIELLAQLDHTSGVRHSMCQRACTPSCSAQRRHQYAGAGHRRERNDRNSSSGSSLVCMMD
jgi:hypothetical protein